jgi:predicted dehydrogenase
VSGLKLDQLCADLSTFVPGRRLDDNVQILLRYQGGARGMLWASQVAPGHENGLRLRVYGAKGGIEWVQAEPNTLLHSPLGAPAQWVTRGSAAAGPSCGEGDAHSGRTPRGLSRGICQYLHRRRDGDPCSRCGPTDSKQR